MKKYLIIFILFMLCTALYAGLPPGKTVDDLIQEANALLSQGLTSGDVKNHMELTYYPYLTRPEVNLIVDYASGSSKTYPNIASSGGSGGAGSINYKSPTGLSGLVLSAMEGVSARAKALGGAFVAIYDDPNSVFRNASGVVQDTKHSMSLVIDGISSGPSISHTSKIAGLYSHKLEHFSLGGSFIYIWENFNDVEASTSYFSLQFNIGSELLKRFTAGLKLKLNNFSYTYLDNSDSNMGFGLDLGICYNYQDFISAGFSFQSYNQFELETYTEKLPSQMIFGGSIKPIGNLTALVDISLISWSGLHEDFSDTANIHIGAEYSIILTEPKIRPKVPYKDIKTSGNILSFRTGIRTETTPVAGKESRTHFTIGAGYKFTKPVQVNLGFDFAGDYTGYTLDANYKI